ncbi:MAG: dihydrofolate reductase family protein [Solirubrobacterales bacterium]
MSKVIWHVTTSVDGFIAGPDDWMDWVFEHRSDGPRLADEVRETTGAILAGRGWYEGAEGRYGGAAGIYGGNWSGPVLVLTHRLDDEPNHPAVEFVGGPVEHAVAEGREAAGSGNLEIFGARVAQQCMDAGVIDEMVVHIAPVLLGDGKRLYAIRPRRSSGSSGSTRTGRVAATRSSAAEPARSVGDADDCRMPRRGRARRFDGGPGCQDPGMDQGSSADGFSR